jgi:hypothetical protein
MYKRILHRSVLLGAVFLLVVTSTVSVVQAANLCVHPNGASQCYSSIQAAVDAANDGDQIIIRSGRYTEQVTIIDKDLTLVGREGAVIQAPADMQTTLFDVAGSGGRPIIGVFNAEVTIRGLTIDGMNLAENNPFLEGITLINAGGVIRDNVIRDMGFGTPTLPLDPNGLPLYQGDGIVVVNFSDTPRTVTITENRATNFNNNGIVIASFPNFNTPDVANLTAHVVENTLVGQGANDVIDQYGILFFSEGFSDPQFSVSGSIRENRIREMVTVSPFPLPGIGIVTFGLQNVQINENVLDNVNYGIDITQSFNMQIIENHITGSQEETESNIGLALSGDNVQVNENRFKRLGFGIWLHVEHPDFGSALNTSLNENKFEDVGAEIMTGAGAPEVALASAVQGSSKWQRYRTAPQP